MRVRFDAQTSPGKIWIEGLERGPWESFGNFVELFMNSFTLQNFQRNQSSLQYWTPIWRLSPRKPSYEHSVKKIKPERWAVFARRCSFRVQLPKSSSSIHEIHQISCWWIDLPSRHKHQSLLSSTTDGQVLSCASCYKTWTETGSAMIPDSSSKTPHNSLTQTCIAD